MLSIQKLQASVERLPNFENLEQNQKHNNLKYKETEQNE